MVALTNGAFPAPPTYAWGRQSNGPVWHEYLAASLGLSDAVLNYAVIGAMTAPAPGYPTGNVWSDTFPGLEGTDVTSQVLEYLSDVGGVADPEALYVLQGGSNDFPRVANPGIVVPHLAQLFGILQASGARHIMVMNLPDPGKTARVILAEEMGAIPPGTGAYFSSVAALINSALVATLDSMAATGVTIIHADAYMFLNNVATAPDDYGMINVRYPYLLFGAGTDPAAWLFWDDLHPTTRGHEIFADEVLVTMLRAYSPRNAKAGPAPVQSLRGLVIGIPNGK
jgi:phospholipase/lecithinase/hemolysin